MNFSLIEISNEFSSVKLLGLELDKTLSSKNHNEVKLDLPKCRLQLTKDSCYYSGIMFYNMLPTVARTVPQRIFKCKVYEWFVKEPLYSIQEFLAYKRIDIQF
ncbi:hypothetical protein C0J52_08272 [Blattella germanica]|nr:hypothetical protein C0J52_08272 [Blattella germanica]